MERDEVRLQYVMRDTEIAITADRRVFERTMEHDWTYAGECVTTFTFGDHVGWVQAQPNAYVVYAG